jgi:hypothetical protein
MRKVALALGSFIVGACCAFAISAGIQTSTWAQPSSGVPGVPVLTDVTIGRDSGIEVIGAIPKIPGLAPEMTEATIADPANPEVTQAIDGLNCVGCTIATRQLTYGGGAYRLPNTKFVGPVNVVFTGAALNGIALAIQLGLLARPTKNWTAKLVRDSP